MNERIDAYLGEGYSVTPTYWLSWTAECVYLTGKVSRERTPGFESILEIKLVNVDEENTKSRGSYTPWGQNVTLIAKKDRSGMLQGQEKQQVSQGSPHQGYGFIWDVMQAGSHDVSQN